MVVFLQTKSNNKDKSLHHIFLSYLLLILISYLSIPSTTSFIIPIPNLRSTSNSNTNNLNANINIHQIDNKTKKNALTILKLRNFDLPECIIFYGINNVITKSIKTNKVKDGVIRLCNEIKNDIGVNTNCAVIILSEYLTVSELKNDILSSTSNDNNNNEDIKQLSSFISSGLITLKSSKELLGSDYDSDSDTHNTSTKGLGYSPSPSALLDSISSVEIQPNGFGGSSGFGTKFADPPRSPLPKHCVVFVNGEPEDKEDKNNNNKKSIQCQNRLSAGRMAGMRVIYIEGNDSSSTSNEIENLADAIIPTLGNENDWDIITLDSISTPGSYWLNPPNSRDDDGNRIYVDDVIYMFEQERLKNDNIHAGDDSKNDFMNKDHDIFEEEKDDEDYLSSILADIDPL